MLGIKFGTGAKVLVFPKNHQARTGILDFFQEPDWNSGLIKTFFLFLKRIRIGANWQLTAGFGPGYLELD
jgi:hypothetical protein